MSYQYTRSQLLSDVNEGIHNKIGMIANQGDFANRIVRLVLKDIALRANKRKVDLTPDIFPEINTYACPADLHANRIIDIPALAKAQDRDDNFNLVPATQFDQDPRYSDIAIDEYNGVRTLKLKSHITSDQNLISELDSLTSGGGTWEAYGDAENLQADSDDYIKGAGSVSFDIDSSGGTTAGIKNTGLDIWDITNFLGGHGAAFAWSRINNVTNLTSFTLHLGSDESNYYSKTITARHDGTDFVSGFNLLRFDLTSLTETGTVDKDAMKYAALFMNKDAAKVSETDYGFDWLTVMNGVRHQVHFYSKYGWQNTSGTYIEKSTDASDYLVADTDEYELFVARGIWLGHTLIKSDRVTINEAKQDYLLATQDYGINSPDESSLMISTYQAQ